MTLPGAPARSRTRTGGRLLAQTGRRGSSWVVVPLAEYRQLRRALEEQQVNEEFDAAQADFLSRRSAGRLCYVSHEEASRRLGLPVQ